MVADHQGIGDQGGIAAAAASDQKRTVADFHGHSARAQCYSGIPAMRNAAENSFHVLLFIR
jgi:hypothetical protein